MQRLFDLLVQFVQQGVAAIFRFVQLVWIWSVGQIATLVVAPWHEWPPQKQGLLIIIVFGIVLTLYWAAKDLWAAGQTILSAFGTLLNVLIRTLPKVLIAGLIALVGVWLLNNLPERLPQLRLENSNGR